MTDFRIQTSLPRSKQDPAESTASEGRGRVIFLFLIRKILCLNLGPETGYFS